MGRVLYIHHQIFADSLNRSGFELDDFSLFDTSTSTWRDTSALFSPTSPTPAARSVAGFVGLPTPQALSFSSSILALLFLGEAESTPPDVGHSGAGAFSSDVWALVVKGDGSEDGSWEWKEATVGEGEKPGGLGWFGSGWWGDEGAVLFGGLAGTNERRGDAWVLRVKWE